MARAQLSRLIQLIVLLQRGQCPNASELAAACEVSRRTIYRDIETMELAGLPIRYEADRQGYRLGPQFAFNAPALRESELFALLVAGHQPAFAGLRLGREARAAVSRLIAALPAAPRSRAGALAEAIAEAVDESWAPGRDDVLDALLGAIAERRQVRLAYDDPDDGHIATKLSPYRLVITTEPWRVIGRSSVHRDVRSFRLCRIERATITDDQYSVPPRFSLKRFLGDAWRLERGRGRHKISVRFSRRVAPEIAARVWHPSQRLEALADGRVELCFAVDGLDEITTWLLAFGDQVEVLAPSELRLRLRELARRMLRVHRDEADMPALAGQRVGG